MTLLTTLNAAVATGSAGGIGQGDIFLIKAVALAWMIPVSFIGYLFFKDAWQVIMRGGKRTGDVVLDIVCPIVGAAFAATYVALALYILFLDDVGINKLLSNHFSNKVYIGIGASGNVNQDLERNTYHHNSARSGRVSQCEDKKGIQGIAFHPIQKLIKGFFVVQEERYRARWFNDCGLWLNCTDGSGNSPGERWIEGTKPSLIWIPKAGNEVSKNFMGQRPILAPSEQMAAQIHHRPLVGVEENESERLVTLMMVNGRLGFGKETAKKHDDVGKLSQLTLFLHKDKLLSGLTGQIKRGAGHGDICESNHVISCAVHKKILAAGTSMRGSAFGAGVVA